MSNVTVKELRKQAQALSIKGYSRMRKADLIQAIAKAEHVDQPAAEPIDFDRSRFTDSDVQEIGKGSLANAAIYISALNAANKGKGVSRHFRKKLRAAGFTAHAGVDVRKIDEYKAAARKAA